MNAWGRPVASSIVFCQSVELVLVGVFSPNGEGLGERFISTPIGLVIWLRRRSAL